MGVQAGPWCLVWSQSVFSWLGSEAGNVGWTLVRVFQCPSFINWFLQAAWRDSRGSDWWGSAPSFTDCVTLGKSLSHPEPHVLHP